MTEIDCLSICHRVTTSPRFPTQCADEAPRTQIVCRYVTVTPGPSLGSKVLNTGGKHFCGTCSKVARLVNRRSLRADLAPAVQKKRDQRAPPLILDKCRSCIRIPITGFLFGEQPGPGSGHLIAKVCDAEGTDSYEPDQNSRIIK